ncbi:MAG: extracellular solute-binding protein [Acetobacteraceae bacterium]|nr:extracellular solute-binding protein [Acetobacteraceae bacterium]
MPARATPPLRRRSLLAAGLIGGGTLAMPSLLRAQAREIVIGGAASHAPWVRDIVTPAFERKHNAKVLFEGTRSLVNLEKMRANKARPLMSVVQMDDPVMILAVQEDLLERMTPASVPNLGRILPGAVHMDGMWANYLTPWQGVAYNTAAKPNGVASWEELWDRANRGRVILPSLQNTEGLANLFIAAMLETKKPFREAQYEVEAGFARLARLKGNLLTVYTQMPQAFNLLEQGEATMIGSALSSFAFLRKAAGAPVDLAAPKEGIVASPSGIALVKGGPNPELARAYVDELLSAEMQSSLAAPVFALPTNPEARRPPGMPDMTAEQIDWAFVARERDKWIARWDREMRL